MKNLNIVVFGLLGIFILSACTASDSGITISSSSAKKIGTTTTEIAPVISKEIVVSFTASRTRGVAPLAIFFDATATTASATSRPYHELNYSWDFDELNVDPTIGHWGDKANGASGSGANTSRKIDSGPVAAHV